MIRPDIKFSIRPDIRLYRISAFFVHYHDNPFVCTFLPLFTVFLYYFAIRNEIFQSRIFDTFLFVIYSLNVCRRVPGAMKSVNVSLWDP